MERPALADNVRYAQRFRFEPITWLSAIAAVTRRIGLIGTASTTYSEPYNLARQFASLDHLSGGRAGWNIVTTSAPQAAQNFGLPEHPPHHERYERAREYLDVVNRLWDSWEDDAVINDPASGIFADTEKVHAINHIGKYFRVRGPLNIPRSPQGRPVYVQAGSSDEGRAFAARFAEAIFTAHQTIASAQEFYSDIKRQARALDRHPDQLKILPGISPFIGSTQLEADRLQEEFNALIQPDYSLVQLRQMLGLDLTGFDLDGPLCGQRSGHRVNPQPAKYRKGRNEQTAFYCSRRRRCRASAGNLRIFSGRRPEEAAQGRLCPRPLHR